MHTKVRPTRQIFLDAVRYFNKYVFNHFTLWFAKRGLGPFSILFHKGRKSGQNYKTPVLATYIEKVIYIPLSYGEQVDWLRNVITQDACVILWKGKRFEATDPSIIHTNSVLHHLPQARQRIFRRFGVESFLQLSRSHTDES